MLIKKRFGAVAISRSLALGDEAKNWYQKAGWEDTTNKKQKKINEKKKIAKTYKITKRK